MSKTLRIAVIPGDGIGKEVMPEGLRVLQAAIERAIRTIVASGKAAGTLVGDTKLARRYLELGATFVAVGIDMTLLAQGTRRLAGEFGLGMDATMGVAGAAAY